ncbi:solute carrier family 45 member 4-like [Cyclopterus lumpus]|uniref:Solute carrier family 45 member 4 n=1 Tax=Cyclopterus lumpus TaxID=8103 RepID=A0A8C2WTJ7_CYCLU|nr:solute carrier family 45 member 4-like [Cyclopterus lumpus]XP_034410007.1 solute carrier family 45 member 4-like [Cyclopterus lumpus]XP_034410008.1 solute carrier family 45 member 4-like [Cyclopterus lumpus]XP_034410009.1 solute carrier family 45 member 4-like [Cyclopterus lumpus]XP_034410011.1 solute carrier family 45 member 4-like [Cyclopterus lumpus]XP_034410012.1 solute carrier family 45 member 4-like [Cyclopterus lumpus]XP_034410013.1 solute carrier family 45 member 4-like [Cyclopteru
MGGEAEKSEASGLPKRRKSKEKNEESEKELEGEDRGMQIPLHRWVMHGAVMFGREFCYAMETALVTPVLLQIGLPEQYYSLTWFLSPILGLLFTPVIGSASDRCTLRWGRRRPFILALCVGVLLGVALFLNGSLIGLSVGDSPGSQPIGIVLTVVGVVVLDFSADASEGPIRAYLLDVADTDEQDMALNIHAFSAGLGGAVGYMLGGLDWTGTALGQAFKSQEQVLFLFAGIIFIISVTLHMFSIPEQPFAPSNLLKDTTSGESTSQLSFRPIGHTPPLLDLIAEEDASARAPSREDDKSDSEEGEMDFFAVDRVRSKSDSILAMPDETIELDSDLDPDTQLFLPQFQHFVPETAGELEDVFKPSNYSIGSSSPSGALPTLSDGMMVLEHTNPDWPVLRGPTNGPPSLLQVTSGLEDSLLRNRVKSAVMVKAVNCVDAALPSSDDCNAMKGHASSMLPSRLSNTSPRPHPHIFYRQPSFTFSYYGRVGSNRFRLRKTFPWSPRPITTSCSLNDLSELQRHPHRRELHLSDGSLSSEGSSSESGPGQGTTVRLLWLSMFKMPRQLWTLCVCHLLTWFSIIAEAVFYTDFMGQVIYHGDPTAPSNSTELLNYHRGVQMGCWGLVVYAATAAVCSAILQKYLDNFDLSIKIVYIVGTLGFSIGTAVMAIFPNVYVVMVMISSMGIISMSISYCPYALLGQYHEIKEYIHHSPANTRRGFGIDCAILSCQVYISQILVASALGAVVEAVGSVRVIPAVASGGSFLGFLTACFLVIYPDEAPISSEQDLGPVAVPGDADPDGGRTSDQRLALLNLTCGDILKKGENHSVA